MKKLLYTLLLTAFALSHVSLAKESHNHVSQASSTKKQHTPKVSDKNDRKSKIKEITLQITSLKKKLRKTTNETEKKRYKEQIVQLQKKLDKLQKRHLLKKIQTIN